MSLANTIPIVLGGRTFLVRQLPIRAEAQWREIARPLVEPLAEMAMAAGLDKPSPERLVKLAFTSALFVDAMAVLNAVLAYAPEAASEREWLEENAYAAEALTALLSLFFGMAAAPIPIPVQANGAAPPPQPTMSTS